MKTELIPINSREKNPRGYVEYTPDNWDGSPLPIHFWLHGLGEDGPGTEGSLARLSDRSVGAWLKNNNIPFIVLLPQDSNGYYGNRRFEDFVKWALSYYGQQINQYGMHGSGLSAGGYGLKQFIIDNSDVYKRFSTFTFHSTNCSTAIPHADKISKNDQHVWFHQGLKDKSPNYYSSTLNFHKAIENGRSRYTLYRDLGHSCWEETYDGSGMSKEQLSNIDGTELFLWKTGSWWDWQLEHTGKVDPIPDPDPVDIEVRTVIRSGKLVYIDAAGNEYEL